MKCNNIITAQRYNCFMLIIVSEKCEAIKIFDDTAVQKLS
jgi:hypothetical protein